MKDFLTTPDIFTAEMSMSEEEQQPCNSNSISPMEEEHILAYPSSQGSYSQDSFYMVSPNQPPHMPASIYGYFGPQDYSSGSDNSMMYTNPQVETHPFMTSGSSYTTTTTPSPTSSISSTQLPNFAGTAGPNMYLRVPKDYPMYAELGFPTHQESSASTTPNSDASTNPSSGFEASSEDKKMIRTSPSGSCVLVSNHMTAAMDPHGDNQHNNNQYKRPNGARENTHGKKVSYNKGQAREKPKKRCSNCHCIQSPSWRRSIAKLTKGALLCNACGLYEKTAKKKRMLVTHDDGNTKVIRKREAREYCCSICGVKDATRWRRVYDSVQCERCSRHRSSVTRA